MQPVKSKSANQIALEFETEAKRLMEISRTLRGRKKPGRKPQNTKAKAK
jgi:hypothetical protein